MVRADKDDMKNRYVRLLAAVLVLAPLSLWMGALKASIDPDPQLHLDGNLELPQDVFPTPEALKPNVAFWRRVFSEWGLGQVALHDADYPAVVYEVVDLPGKVDDSLGTEQLALIRRHREALERRLSHIAAAGDEAALSADDRSLRQSILAAGGVAALVGAADRVRAQRGLRERFQRGLEISGRYDRAFREVFKEEGVPEDLAYLPHVESSFQNHARSSAGAAGMWQFTRSAGRRFMTVNRAVDQRMDPVAAARGAARYLRQAYEQLGSWPLAITAYNHGIQGMLRAKAQYGADFNRIVQNYDSRSFGFASRNFYAEFLAARAIARAPETYFGGKMDIEPPLALDSVVLDKPMRSGALSERYGIKHSTLVALNPAWTRRAARDSVKLPAGTEVWLPAGTLSRAAESPAPAPAAGGVMEVSFSPPSAETSSPSPVSVFHIVRRNETLSTIAAHYRLSVATLRALNDIPRGRHTIYAGQKLRVREAVEPAVGGRDGDTVIHVVRKGDTLGMIAAAYGVSLRDLLEANRLSRHATIRPGQHLGIPVAR
jgi:membrane-bound lytic murein transglycosylase D